MEALTQHITALAQHAFQTQREVRIIELPGGASTRRFFRVSTEAASGIVMFVPDATKPDEIAKTDESNRRWPFLEVRELLEERGIPVPRLLGEACDQGLMLVEDLGDETLAKFLERRPEAKAAIYRRAVLDLASAQRALDPHSARFLLPADSIVRARRFDFDLLKWELDHFLEWGLSARGIQLNSADLAAFEAAATHIARTIASWPTHFVHRDYQSRNLMVLGGEGQERLHWIDFQDALLGPRVYDLVALLNDSYQSFTREFVEDRLEEFGLALELSAEERARVVWEFDYVTIQRKLKDAGRFVFIDRVRNNPDYLEFVEPTIEKAFSSMERCFDDPVVRELHQLLKQALSAK